ncbi:response regulator [Pleurocapsales cyanobacterium LEGE 06147]|nr:response regulator [Pleurocapsales cyanobacterium LEGE 06147]
MRILLVDDDEPLMEALANNLIEQHYAVDIAIDGEAAWEYVSLFTYDLIVLDVMLPKLDGVSLCQRLRSEGYQMPILLLTARDRSIDKVRGLNAGADDYVVKPFDFAELTARIRALLRRESRTLPPILQWENLSLDSNTCNVTYQEQPLHLTPKEYALLELFLRNPKHVYSAGAIIENLWSFEDPPGEDAVRTHIKGLRQKLKQAGAPANIIETVYGIGYRLKSFASQSPAKTAKAISRAKKTTKAKHNVAVAEAWENFKQVMEERLAILSKAVVALKEQQSNEKLQQQAKATAHKLAGSLGSFGFSEGSKIAREVEQLLEAELPLTQEQARQLDEIVNVLHSEIKNKSPEHNCGSQLSEKPLLLIGTRDEQWARQLAQEAGNWNLRTAIASTLSSVRELLTRELPAIALLKTSFPNEESLVLLREIHARMPSLPMVVVMEGGDFNDRLQVVRQGGNLVLQYPVTPVQAIESVSDLLEGSGSRAKILIVDDDPQLLAATKIALQPWGFQLTTLDNPKQFWSVLAKVNPNLLVLDVEMPEVSGMELCQVLRSDPQWQRLPVLFLTVHQDEKTQHQAFALGADDFISKPVVGAELANRILNRLERIRSIK